MRMICVDGDWRDHVTDVPCRGPELGLIYDVTETATFEGKGYIAVDGWPNSFWQRSSFRPVSEGDCPLERLATVPA